MKDKYKTILYIFLIAVIGFIAYSNTFNVPFQFDDDVHIVNGRVIKDLNYFVEPSKAKNLKYPDHFTLMSEYEGLKARYFGFLTFALNYRLHGLDVTGYHVFNLLIHIINAVLVYFLVLITFKTPSIMRLGNSHSQLPLFTALFSALLFVSHPVQTQGVTYIVQRFASLATLFYLLSVVMYARWRLSTVDSRFRVFWYLASIISAIAAMKTKEIAFTLPVVIVLYEILFFDGKLKKRVLFLMPIILTMLIIPLGLMGVDNPGIYIGGTIEIPKIHTDMSSMDYLYTQFRVIVTYVRLLFFPVNQSLVYDYPVFSSFFDLEVLLSFLFLLSIFGLGIFLLYCSRCMVCRDNKAQSGSKPPNVISSRIISFGIFWFLITLSVESSIIPIGDVIFEHRVYLPSAGAFIAITASVFLIAGKLKQRWQIVEKAVFPVFMAVILVFAGATYARNTVWQDEVSLWEDVVSKNPENLRGYYNLGVAYTYRNETKKALETYDRALAVNSNFLILYNAYNSRGVAYLKTGQIKKALADFNLAAQITPYDDFVFYNRAVAYVLSGDVDKAISDFRKACNLGNMRGCEDLNRLLKKR